MSDTAIRTIPSELKKLFAANVTDASTTPEASVESIAEGDGIFAMERNGGVANNFACCLFGTADDGGGAEFIVEGKLLANGEVITVPLGKVTATFGTGVGSGGLVSAEEKFADTFAFADAADQYSPQSYLISPANNTVAWFVVDAQGCQFIRVSPAKGNNCTDVNLLATRF